MFNSLLEGEDGKGPANIIIVFQELLDTRQVQKQTMLLEDLLVDFVESWGHLDFVGIVGEVSKIWSRSIVF